MPTTNDLIARLRDVAKRMTDAIDDPCHQKFESTRQEYRASTGPESILPLLDALETLQRERDEAVRDADRYMFLRRRAVMVDYSDETITRLTLFKDEGPTGEFLDDWVDGEIDAISTLTKPADGEKDVR